MVTEVLFMSTYQDAREKTKHKIFNAFWNLYIHDRKITVNQICDAAGIHRSTFYFYYESVEDVLKEIETRLFNELTEILSEENRKTKPSQTVMMELRNMFRENRKFLIPLVVKYKDGAFAFRYRECLKERFAYDIGLDYRSGNAVKNDAANCVLAGMIEMMLYELSSEILPSEYTYVIGNGIINKGVARTMTEDLNIKFGNQ